MTEGQFAEVKAFALAPWVGEPLADDDHVRKVIGALAGVLKMRRMDEDGAKFQMGMYRKALAGFMTAEALTHAADTALRECEWMPTPAELIKFADGFVGAERQAKRLAGNIVEARTKRTLAALAKRVRQREIPIEEIASIDGEVLQWAERERIVAQDMDGVWFYATAEALKRDREARAAFTAALFTPATSTRPAPKCRACQDVGRVLSPETGDEMVCSCQSR